MHTRGILIMVLGLAVGVATAYWLSVPGEARSPSPTPVDRSATADQKQSSVVSVSEPVAEATPPENGQSTEFEKGWVVRWQRGRTEVSGWQANKRAWVRELPFSVADVVRGESEDEVRVVSVDALQARVLKLNSGNVKSSTKPVTKKGDVPNLLAEAKTVHAQALKKMEAGDGHATLAACDRLSQLANQLSDAKRPNDAFRIWAAAKKLRRAVAPEKIGKTLPREEQPALEDLEF